MKVNMTPNPLDVVTIHASQGDTEARQWEFELHNNGELIDTSEITEQLFFKAYKGGTEQILPENTSTPTTSPFKGDIRYPQGLLTDQEFTYRQSPTESDGLAKITDIKGNTLVWNQLQLIPTNSSTTSNGITFTNNNDGSVTANGTATGTAIFYCNSFSLTSGHKYLFKGCPSGGTNNTYMQSIRVNSASTIIGTDVGNGDVYTANANYTDGSILLRILSGVTLNNAKFYPQVFDLTQMGLDSITDPAEFTSLFPLSYYSYNQGSLLSFMGNGIKTVGKNLNPWQGVNYSAVTDRTIFLKKGNYVLSTENGNVITGNSLIYLCLVDNGNIVTEGGITSSYLYLNTARTFYYGGENRNNIPFTLNRDSYVSFGFNNQKPTSFNAIQLEFGSVATDYEPYTSSTLDRKSVV